MSAAALLARLRELGIEARSEGGSLLLRGRATLLPADLRQALAEQKSALIALLAAASAPAPASCSACGQVDYLPLGGGWRRCWSCGQRWGPPGQADPGDPPGLLGFAPLDVEPPRLRGHEAFTHLGRPVPWWRRPDGEAVCALCHPCPSPQPRPESAGDRSPPSPCHWSRRTAGEPEH